MKKWIIIEENVVIVWSPSGLYGQVVLSQGAFKDTFDCIETLAVNNTWQFHWIPACFCCRIFRIWFTKEEGSDYYSSVCSNWWSISTYLWISWVGFPSPPLLAAPHIGHQPTWQRKRKNRSSEKWMHPHKNIRFNFKRITIYEIA